VRHFAASAANYSISTLVLQKQHSFKRKRRFSQVHKQKIKSKQTYMQILSLNTYEMQRKTPVMTRRTQEISLIEW